MLRCQASCAGGCGVGDVTVPSEEYRCKIGSHCDGIVSFRDLVQLARDLVELPWTKLNAMSERSHDMTMQAVRSVMGGGRGWSIESGSVISNYSTAPSPEIRPRKPRASRSLHHNATGYVSGSPFPTISVSSHRLTANRCVCVVRHATVLNAFRDSQPTEFLILEF